MIRRAKVIKFFLLVDGLEGIEVAGICVCPEDGLVEPLLPGVGIGRC